MVVGIREPRKTITLNLPKVVAKVLSTQIEGKSLSERIRKVLEWNVGRVTFSDLNMSELKTKTSESLKHNFMVTLKDFTIYEQGACRVGMSLSNYITMLLAHALHNAEGIDFELESAFSHWEDIDFDTQRYPARKQAPRYRVYAKGLDKLSEQKIVRPIPSKEIIAAIDFYESMSKQTGELLAVDLTGYFYQARHNEQVVSLKIPLPVHYENKLIEFAKRSLISKGAMLIKVLLFSSVIKQASVTFKGEISH